MTIPQEVGSALDKSIDRSFDCNNLVNMSTCYNNFGNQNESHYLMFSEQTPVNQANANRNNNTLNISRVGGLLNHNDESMIDQVPPDQYVENNNETDMSVI